MRTCRGVAVLSRTVRISITIIAWMSFATALAESPTEGRYQPEPSRLLDGQAIRQDLEQFRSLLKHEWILGNLNKADFAAAIEALARDAQHPMTLAEFELRLQTILALGEDGHAGMSGLLPALRSISGTYPDVIIDVSGDEYVVYRIEDLPNGPINSRYKYRFRAIEKGFPYLVAIDGVPIEQWVSAASRYVPTGPPSAIRWRSMYLLPYLPVFRQELGLAERQTIPLTLQSLDQQRLIETQAPTFAYQRSHLKVPKPDWRIINRFGYIWVRNPASGGCEVILEAMPKFRETEGLIIDLRGNTGGAGIDALLFLAGYLLPPDSPRLIVGQVMQWKGTKWNVTNLFATDPADAGLSADARKLVKAFMEKPLESWLPPEHRPTERRPILLARPEAEPNLFPYNLEQFPKDAIYHYDKPVVVLSDNRVFSSGELLLAGLAEISGVTIIGSKTTAAGGGTSTEFRLEQSGLAVRLCDRVFLRADGSPIDGRGISPDIRIEPDAEYYFGQRDRALERAVEFLSNAE
jgi:hypothetical protein